MVISVDGVLDGKGHVEIHMGGFGHVLQPVGPKHLICSLYRALLLPSP